MSRPWLASPIVMFGFNSVVVPTTSKYDDKEHFYAQILVPATAQDTKEWKEIQSATKRFAVTEFGSNATDVAYPFKPVNGSKDWPSEIVGSFNVKSGKDFPPVVMWQDGTKVTDQRDAYPGIQGRISFQLFPWNKAGRRGVSYSLLNVQLFRGSGTRLRGARPAGEEFGGLPPLTGDDEIDSIM